jgi:BirA family biotin operon repressor/biotin-[acetyl-CoA-carboxylase] ligase
MHEIHLNSVDSTNTYAKKHLKDFPPGITCITADEQTAGRGRYQRTWVSPKGVNIYATFVFQLPHKTAHLASLAQVMAYSLSQVLIHEGLEPKIKWPNDVQLRGKKVSGVLCETEFSENKVDVFLGVGLNVNLDEPSAKKIDQPATSLLIETGQKWDQAALLKKLQKQFVLDLEKFKQGGFAPFHDAFELMLALKGETVSCFDGKEIWTGICHSLTKEGQLNLLMPNSTIHTMFSGDIKP